MKFASNKERAKGGEIMRKATIILLTLMLASLMLTGIAYAGAYKPPTLGAYIVVPVAEGGMKCMLKKDYSEFCIMPPGYSMRVQVFKRGSNGAGYALVTSGVTVEYSIESNTYSQDGSPAKTNFWTYVSDFGWNWPMDTGSKGYKLSGTMAKTPDGLGYEALKVPQTPFLDGGNTTEAPYQNGVICVKDSSGNILTTQKFIMPASTEQRCYKCHGGTGGADTDKAIVQAHDKLAGTTLATDGKANLCADCHADPSVGKAGNGKQKYLSTSMHSWHVLKMPGKPAYDPVCYYCHPGLTNLDAKKSECNRGRMRKAGKKCDSPGCHGGMDKVGSSTRTPWSADSLPKCVNCHQAIYAENTGKKYMDSILVNGPDPDMNGKMYCQTCHGDQHAEWPSTLAGDNQVPVALQNTSNPLGDDWCGMCHATGGPIPTSGTIHK